MGAETHSPPRAGAPALLALARGALLRCHAGPRRLREAPTLRGQRQCPVSAGASPRSLLLEGRLLSRRRDGAGAAADEGGAAGAEAYSRLAASAVRVGGVAAGHRDWLCCLRLARRGKGRRRGALRCRSRWWGGARTPLEGTPPARALARTSPPGLSTWVRGRLRRGGARRRLGETAGGCSPPVRGLSGPFPRVVLQPLRDPFPRRLSCLCTARSGTAARRRCCTPRASCPVPLRCLGCGRARWGEAGGGGTPAPLSGTAGCPPPPLGMPPWRCLGLRRSAERGFKEMLGSFCVLPLGLLEWRRRPALSAPRRRRRAKAAGMRGPPPPPLPYLRHAARLCWPRGSGRRLPLGRPRQLALRPLASARGQWGAGGLSALPRSVIACLRRLRWSGRVWLRRPRAVPRRRQTRPGRQLVGRRAAPVAKRR